MNKNKIRLVCDNEKIDIDQEVANKSPVLKSMIEDTGKEGDIVIPNIKAPILRKVIEYCTHYRNSKPKDIKKPLLRRNLVENGVDQWDANFINLDQTEELIDLVVAANFLDIESLLDLGCAKIAVMIKDKSVEEIREFLDIDNDFTAEEEKRVNEESKVTGGVF